MCTMYITGEDFVKFIMDFYKKKKNNFKHTINKH